MKRLLILVTFATAVSAVAQLGADAGQGSSNQDERPVVKTWTEQGDLKLVKDTVSDWEEYDRKSNETMLHCADGSIQRIKGQIKLGRLEQRTSVNNYDWRTGKPHAQWLESGTLVWFDEAGNIIAKASCKNPISVKIPVPTQTKQINTTIFMERERTKVYERDIHHYTVTTITKKVPEPYPVEVPRPYPVYQLTWVFPPQQQYIGQLGAPTVVSPTFGGLNLGFTRTSDGRVIFGPVVGGTAGGGGGGGGGGSSSSSSAAAAAAGG